MVSVPSLTTMVRPFARIVRSTTSIVGARGVADVHHARGDTDVAGRVGGGVAEAVAAGHARVDRTAGRHGDRARAAVDGGGAGVDEAGFAHSTVAGLGAEHGHHRRGGVGDVHRAHDGRRLVAGLVGGGIGHRVAADLAGVDGARGRHRDRPLAGVGGGGARIGVRGRALDGGVERAERSDHRRRVRDLNRRRRRIVRRRVRIGGRRGDARRGDDRGGVRRRAVGERDREGERRRRADRQRGERALHRSRRSGGRRVAGPARRRRQRLKDGVGRDRGGERDVGGRQVVVRRVERLLVGVGVVGHRDRVSDRLPRRRCRRRGADGGREIRARELQRIDERPVAVLVLQRLIEQQRRVGLGGRLEPRLVVRGPPDGDRDDLARHLLEGLEEPEIGSRRPGCGRSAGCRCRR